MTGASRLTVRLAQESDLAAWQAFVDAAPEAGCMHHAGWLGVLREAFSGHAQEALAVVAEGVVHVARPHHGARAGADVRQRAARLERHDDGIAGHEAVLRDKARSVQPGLLAAREDEVNVMRLGPLPQRCEREHRHRAQREVIGRSQMQLVAARVEPR